MDNGPASRPAKRAKKGSACLHCRHMKLKCDLATTASRSCTRCTRTGKNCSDGQVYRRTTNKQRLDTLENEFKRMQQRMEAANTLTPLPQYSHEASEINEWDDWTEETALQNMTSQTLESVTLQGHEILALIKEFYATLHPLFPILPSLPDFIKTYNANRLLLWTVIAVACKESAQYTHLYVTLVDPVRRLAGDLYNTQSRHFETIQALLLLCIWPFPFQQTAHDPSPMYCGLATQLSYQLGLHRPNQHMHWEYGATGSNYRVDLQRRKAWIGCFVVNHIISTRLGTPSAVQPGHAILLEIAKISTSELPAPLLHYAHIAYVGMKALEALGDDASSATGEAKYPIPLVTTFDQKLTTMRESLSSKWSSLAEAFFLETKLQILSFALDEDNYPDSMLAVDLSALTIYDRASTASQRVLELAAMETSETRYWPIFAKHSSMYATIMAFRLACIAQPGSSQQARLQQTILDGVTLVKSWSMFQKDNFGRFCSHMEYLSRKLGKNQKESLPTLWSMGSWQEKQSGFGSPFYKPAVKSRMAANITYDTIWASKHAILEEEQKSRVVYIQDPDQSLRAGLADVHHVSPMRSADVPGLPVDFLLDDNAFLFNESSDIMNIFEDWENLVGNS
ncbi:hypothetical protein BO94DRAFT_590574 [Aspergillus sclerotioniger CBS 115572]|uniref:Zn(2)-C6 fungal-type domain-containing protein n=1 Tax=Aspergillus sclerotioniger CBS 115572 TaxID=1450535 RepID=A0A317V3Z2_9EURO|nr:hypothetical protein BO94DRAFT_590574 [Aspergillus sclerotioniger CBS 115572]PWY68993.1 hypothetical protein BO94DRAFT_590574 [Aspergillus sclerotioniger CBS 115572]